MPTRLQVIKCNPNFYKGTVLKWGTNPQKVFPYQVNPLYFKKRDTLVAHYRRSTNSLQIVNKITNSHGVVTTVSLAQYDGISFQFAPLTSYQSKRQIVWTFKPGFSYTLNLEAVLRSDIKRGSKLPVVGKPPVKEEQPARIVKPYWQKRSDSSRNQFVRAMRYSELLGMTSDGRVKRDSNTRRVAAKFLAWKLNLNSAQTSKAFQSNKVARQLDNSLVHWLTAVGFFTTYTQAQKAIDARQIFVNGQVVLNQLDQLGVWDSVSVLGVKGSPSVVPPEMFQYASVDADTMSFTVLKLLNSASVYQQMLGRLQYKVNGSLLVNPLSSIFVRGRLMTNRIWR